MKVFNFAIACMGPSLGQLIFPLLPLSVKYWDHDDSEYVYLMFSSNHGNRMCVH
jgi:hypothetical protein